jgi:predicted deacetylase
VSVAGGGAGVLTVTLHDVAPATRPACEALLAAIARRAGIPLTLLVVPRYHGQPADAAFEHWLDRAAGRGAELALHGFTHRDGGRPRGWFDRLRRRWYTAGEGEFAGLDEAQARRLLHAGRNWFAARGWPLHGFVAPAWLMSAGTRAALQTAGFDYTATLSRLIRLPAGRELASLGVVYSTRAPWRRAASLRWGALVAAAQRERALLRLELHPPDALYPDVLASWLELLDAALAARQPLTVADAVRRLEPRFGPPRAPSQ